MSIFDVFENDAFGLVEMSDALDRREYVPTGLADMGIFVDEFIRTEDVAIEMGSSKLNIIQTTSRGEPLAQLKKRSRSIRKFSTTRIGQGTTIEAGELDFLRQMGTEDQFASLAQELADRLGHGNSLGLLDNLDVTMERMMLGCVQGKVLDADDTILWDWAQEFDNAVAEGGTGTIKTVEFDLSPTQAQGNFQKQVNELVRDMATNSGGTFIPNKTKMVALVGNEFFDKLSLIPEVRQAQANQMKNAYMVDGNDAFGKVEFPLGMVWKNYRGTDDGSTVAIKPDECHVFPTNTRGAFKRVFAHGESFDDLGQKGKRYYANTIRDVKRDQFVELEAMTYPLLVCTVPKTLRKLTIK